MPIGKLTPLACRENITRYWVFWSGFHSYSWRKTLPFSIYSKQKCIFLYLGASQDLWLQQSSPAVHCLSPWVAETRRKKCVSAQSQFINASGNTPHRSHLSLITNSHIQNHLCSSPAHALQCRYFGSLTASTPVEEDFGVTIPDLYPKPIWPVLRASPCGQSDGQPPTPREARGEAARSHSSHLPAFGQRSSLPPPRRMGCRGLPRHTRPGHRLGCGATPVLVISKAGRTPHSMNSLWRLLPPGLGAGLGHLEQQREGRGLISKLSLIFSMAFPSEFPGIYY